MSQIWMDILEAEIGNLKTALAAKETELEELREKVKAYIFVRDLGMEGMSEMLALRAAAGK